MGCRVKASVDDLLRIVVQDGVLVPDPARRLPGRGAHLHPDQQCYTQAVRRKALTRALRLESAASSEEVENLLAILGSKPDNEGRRPIVSMQ